MKIRVATANSSLGCVRWHGSGHGHSQESHGHSHVVGHSHSHALPLGNSAADQAAKRLTWVGLWSDVGLFGIKGVIGYLSGSAALVADALHSGSDLAAGFVTLSALKLARKEPDLKHPYGYGHYETLGTLGVSAMLFAGSASSIYYALGHLVKSMGDAHAVELEHVGAALGCCAVSVLVKEALFWITKKEGDHQKSPVLIANAWHHRSDSLSSFAAFFGIAGFAMGYPVLDPLLGLAVGGLVLKTSGELGWDAIANITDRQRSADIYLIHKVEEIGDALKEETRGEIQNVHNVRCRRLGNYLLMDIHITVDPRLSVSAASVAASKVRLAILRDIPEIREVLVKVQTHQPRKFLMTHEPQEKNSDIPAAKPVFTYRHQFEIEQDVKSKVAQVKGIEGVSHIAMHYDRTSQSETSVAVEVNLKMDKTLTLQAARQTAELAKAKILEISDIHDVDIHIEIL